VQFQHTETEQGAAPRRQKKRQSCRKALKIGRETPREGTAQMETRRDQTGRGKHKAKETVNMEDEKEINHGAGRAGRRLLVGIVGVERGD